MQQRPAGGQFIDGRRVWLIDYEYSRQQRPLLNSATSGPSAANRLSNSTTWSLPTDPRATSQNRTCAPAGNRQQWLDTMGMYQSATSPIDFDLGLGDGALLPVAGSGLLFPPPPRRRAGVRLTVRTTCRHLPPDRAQIVVIGGGVIGTSVAYHPTHKLGRTDGAARAGPVVLWHNVARRRFSSDSCGRPEKGTPNSSTPPALCGTGAPRRG